MGEWGVPLPLKVDPPRWFLRDSYGLWGKGLGDSTTRHGPLTTTRSNPPPLTSMMFKTDGLKKFSARKIPPSRGCYMDPVVYNRVSKIMIMEYDNV